MPQTEAENRRIAGEVEKIHMESPDKGYRRIRDDLQRYHGIDVNDKRVLRICRKLGIKSTIKYANEGCTQQADKPQFIAENILNREFTADAPNQKWLTDVTEFKYDDAVAQNPDAHPLFHSDRGFQYTNRIFHAKIEAAGMVQSMSRVGKCLDNGPMEGFWGILKRERYYGRKFTDKETLMKMIEDYIEYYNNKRLQRNLGVLTPFEKYQSYFAGSIKKTSWNYPAGRKIYIFFIVYLTGSSSARRPPLHFAYTVCVTSISSHVSYFIYRCFLLFRVSAPKPQAESASSTISRATGASSPVFGAVSNPSMSPVGTSESPASVSSPSMEPFGTS